MKNPFRVGDMVIVTDSFSYPRLNGSVGRVVTVSKLEIGVDFSDGFLVDGARYSFHRLSNRLEANTGWYLPFTDVRPYEEDRRSFSLTVDDIDAFLCE